MTSLRTVQLKDVSDINPRIEATPHLNAAVSLVPMSAVDQRTGAIEPQERLYGDIGSGLTPFLDGDILVGKITPCFENGKIAHARIPHFVGFGSTEFHVIRGHPDDVEPRYLFHYLRQDWVRIEGASRMTGSAGQRRVPQAFLSSLAIPLPPLPEQRRIAAILDQADALRAKRRVALAYVETLPQSVFLEMFGDPETNPKGWDEKTIGELCLVKGGKRLPRGAKYSSVPTPFRYIRVTDLQAGSVDESALLYLPPDVQAGIKRYTVQTGDVIISIAGSIGLIAPVPPSADGANLTENAAKLVPIDAGRYDPAFLSASLRTPCVQRQIRSHVGQVTIGKLALFRIEKLRVCLPPIDLQREFANRLKTIQRACLLQRSALADLDALFASLQLRAFRGEL